MKYFLTSVLILVFITLSAQNSILKGRISSPQGEASDVKITLQKGKNRFQTVSLSDGTYRIEVPNGEYKLTISLLGMQTINESIHLNQGQTINKDFQLKEDLLGLDEVIITGTRNDLPQFLAPVVVSKISARTFELTQSLSLAEGLKFTPGLRTETNCQNCGTNQLRINGLDGGYSQILINGRQVFSALTGVYGLEMIPANMISHIEVVRGGGSALYGGNAIAGTVNILTRDPLENSFSVGNNLSLYQGKTPDNTLFANGSIVSPSLDKGITLFAYNRNRKPFDANGDEYSEITQLENTSFGADMFWNTSERSKLKANFNTISEFRRGGNKFDLLAHESDITEQLRHNITGGDVSFEHYSRDFAHKLSYYASFQHTIRKSYYGTGIGIRVSSPDDFNALDEENLKDTNPDNDTEIRDEFINSLSSYGKSTGMVSVLGAQYNYNINDHWDLTFGSEYNRDNILDFAKKRTIDQTVRTYGSYLQLQWKPIEHLTLLAGSRYDYVDIKGLYKYLDKSQDASKTLSKFVPRFTAMYDIDHNFKIRASYAQGYRVPQAFDEDLHLDVLGGEVIFVEIDKNLKTETSNSFTASINYTQKKGNTQANLIAEGFFTRINDGFINEFKANEGGITHKVKQNASDYLDVFGANLELDFAFSKQWLWQTGLTFQKSRYSQAQTIWSNEEDADDKRIVTESRVLRTPDLYGYTNLTYTPDNHWKISYSGVLTGSMITPKVISESEPVELVKTPSFFEQSLRLAYNLPFKDGFNIEFSAGVQNIFNNYQKDFTVGKDRDPNYIYGPQRPRTYFMGITCKLN